MAYNCSITAEQLVLLTAFHFNNCHICGFEGVTIMTNEIFLAYNIKVLQLKDLLW